MKIVLIILLFTYSLSFAFEHPFNNKHKFAIHGYDPVSYLLEKRAIKGKRQFSSTYQGQTFLFASLKDKKIFDQTPQKYLPAYGGWCAYAAANGEEVDIDPQTFKVINGKTYLFYNGLWGNTLKDWNKDEKNLKAKADQLWQEFTRR